MKNLIKCFGAILITTIFSISCRKNNSTPTPVLVDDITTVTASIKGVVVNENDIPVLGATVTIGANTLTTNAFGQFELLNKSVSQNNTYIKVAKTGYFNGSRSLITQTGKTHLVRIKLIPKNITGTFTASGGGIVTNTSGGKVTFPANAIVDASGIAYTGIVNVAMAYINPTATDLGSKLVGDLRGITLGGEENVLATYGMLGVELTSTAGQDLKIATGKTAQITVPLPASLVSGAPATIPLWHFDETTGRWKEEGSALKVGNEYIGSVSHFSFWNFDHSGTFVKLCLTVLNSTGIPLNNVQVKILRSNTGSISNILSTDANGNLCGNVFKNEPLILSILDRCGNAIYSQNIGPYSSDASITINVTIPPNTSITFTGTVTNCSNTPIANGQILIQTNNGYSYTANTNASGVFNLSILGCGGLINYSITPIDFGTSQQGNTISGSFTSGTVNTGALKACGSNINEFVNLTIDGVPYSWYTGKPNNILGMGPDNSYPIAPLAFESDFAAYDSTIYLTSGGLQTADFVEWIARYNATPGSYPLHMQEIYLESVPLRVVQVVSPANPQVNLTAVGALGSGFLEGNYNVNMLFVPGNIVRNVQCNFKIRRN